MEESAVRRSTRQMKQKSSSKVEGIARAYFAARTRPKTSFDASFPKKVGMNLNLKASLNFGGKKTDVGGAEKPFIDSTTFPLIMSDFNQSPIRPNDNWFQI